MKKNIIFMPHANIQYSQLAPEKRAWVIKNCYGKLFDLVERKGYRIAFEASGYTIDEIAKLEPEVTEKLKKLIENHQIEPVASPYTHFMVSNVPKKLCVYALKHSVDAWEKVTGVRPVIGWNPECSWNSDVPDIYKEAGLEGLVMDADSFYLSFPDVRAAAELNYDVESHSNKNKLTRIEEYIKDKPKYLQYLLHGSVAPNGLKLLFRSDCMANTLLWHLMGTPEEENVGQINKAKIRNMFQTWADRITDEEEFILPYAEDAEYIGSTAYFYVKQFNQARFFEPAPDSVERFEEIVDLALEVGFEMKLPSELLSHGLIENPYVDQIENGVAWHGGTARAWMNTDFAVQLDPVCKSIYEGIENLMKLTGETWETQDRTLLCALNALESAWVSDSRWPPHPTSPGRFNVRETLDDLYQANDMLAEFMKEKGIENKAAFYSPAIMDSQIRCTEKKLMAMEYFGEEKNEK